MLTDRYAESKTSSSFTASTALSPNTSSVQTIAQPAARQRAGAGSHMAKPRLGASGKRDLVQIDLFDFPA